MNTVKDYLNVMINEAFETGDYSEIKDGISRLEQDNVFLTKEDNKGLEVLKYFASQNKKIYLYFFSHKDTNTFERAILKGDMKKAHSYLKKYKKFQVFEWIKNGEIEKIAEALNAGLNPNKKTDRGLSLLEAAIGMGQTETLRLLVEKGARVNPAFWERKRVHPLILAVENNQTEMALLLLSNGAEIAGRYFKGDALTHAVEHQNEEVIEGILTVYQEKYASHSFDQEYFWGNGEALKAAIKLKNEKIVKRLLDVAPLTYSDISKAVESRDKNIIDLVYEKATKEERAQMACYAMSPRTLDVQFHLYQKKCPVFPEYLEKFTLNHILFLTILSGQRDLFDEIISTLSDEEKTKIDWKQVKSDVTEYLPTSVQKRTMSAFKDVFAEEIQHELCQTGRQVSFMPSPNISFSGSLCDEMGRKIDCWQGGEIMWQKNEKLIIRVQDIVSDGSIWDNKTNLTQSVVISSHSSQKVPDTSRGERTE